MCLSTKFSFYFLSAFPIWLVVLISLILNPSSTNIFIITLLILMFIITFINVYKSLKKIRKSKQFKTKIRSISEYKSLINIPLAMMLVTLPMSKFMSTETVVSIFIYAFIIFLYMSPSQIIKGNLILCLLGYHFYVCEIEKSTSKVALNNIIIISKNAPVDEYNNITKVSKLENDILFGLENV